MRWLAKVVRLFARPPAEPSSEELPIKPLRYASRLTGEAFERYDPEMQEAARLRREAAEAARKNRT